MSPCLNVLAARAIVVFTSEINAFGKSRISNCQHPLYLVIHVWSAGRADSTSAVLRKRSDSYRTLFGQGTKLQISHGFTSLEVRPWRDQLFQPCAGQQERGRD
jgi:hypothetical protein